MMRTHRPPALPCAWRNPLLRLASLAALALRAGLGACGGGGGGSASSPPAVETATAQGAALAQQQALVSLGQQLFNDTNLSSPAGTSCASCHQAATGFSNLHGSSLGVAQGSLPGALGLRTPNQAVLGRIASTTT